MILGRALERFSRPHVSTCSRTRGGRFISACHRSELHTLYEAFTKAGGHWSTFLIWGKNHFTLGRSDYQRKFEPILYGWKEGTQRYWCGARDQGDLWLIDRPHANDLHPTMKPVELVERAVLNSSKRGEVVLDAFGGSGSTLIACEKTGRKARLIEIDPHFVDVIVGRWQDFTGRGAILENEERTFRKWPKSGFLVALRRWSRERRARSAVPAGKQLRKRETSREPQ